MQQDPRESRRNGTHRVRVVTASVGAAAIVGTGVLTWAVAANAATQDGTTTDPSTADSESGAISGSSGESRLSPRQQLPGNGGSGNVHGSSGGS